MNNLQTVIQNKTREILKQEFSEYVERNMGVNFYFDPIDWQPDWDTLAEEVITSEEVIEASEKYAETYGRSILADSKEEEREYQENN